VPFAGRIPEAEANRDYFVQKDCYALEGATKKFFVNDRIHQYIHPQEKPFSWIRGYQLGGRSQLWARQTYRWSDIDFRANKLMARD
jgi:choline dehydrogenase-like flavoprotein